MGYKIDLNLKKIWDLRAHDCPLKKKEIKEVIKDINFSNFNYKQLCLIHTRLKKLHKSHAHEGHDAKNDLQYIMFRFYNLDAMSWLLRNSPTLPEVWEKIKRKEEKYD